jgi:TolB protein
MLLRFYRITDKLGVAVLKSFVALGQYSLDGATYLIHGLQGGFAGVFRTLWGMLMALWRGVRWFALTVWRVVRWFALTVWRVVRWIGVWLGRGLGVLLRATGVATSLGLRSAAGGARSARRVMARRSRRRAKAKLAAEAATNVPPEPELLIAEPEPVPDPPDMEFTEDPLRAQNRALSIVVVMLGFTLLAALIWATSVRSTGTKRGGAVGAPNPDDVNFVLEGRGTPTADAIISTPVPTATSIPSVLAVRGSIAYTVRERGQLDLWALEVGTTNPVRITNDPADERDPAWSPDGRKLAYASRQDGNWEIYIYDPAAEQTTRLTYDLAFQGNPAWSPDGAFIVYESYQGSNLDLYIVPVDGSDLPIRLTDNASADFAPTWSADGRRIAFTSWRTGNQDIFVISLDDPRDEGAINLTNSPERNEDHPAWSPDDSNLIAYSALDEGIEKVFVKSADDPNAPAQVLERGRTPTWSPDGTSLVFAVDSSDSTHLVAAPFAQSGVATEIIPVLSGTTSPAWTSAPLPAPLVNSGGLGPAVPTQLFEEQSVRFDTDPPYRLDTLVNVDAPNAVLNDRVNDSFNALRERANETIGIDFLGELEDAFWRIDRPPQPGEERRNWHMTGRAFSMNRSGIAGFPPPLEIVREDIGVNTYWRVYVRVAEDAQNGQLGEPLRQMPWDIASRNQGDIEAYDQGGRLRREMPTGYYADLTQLAADYGWDRVPAGRDWRANFNSINFWMFYKTENLNWYDAMREIYTEAQLGGFAAPTRTPVPAAPITVEPGGA